MDRSTSRLVGVELGGTKAIVVLGQGGEILDRARFEVGPPDETLSAIAARLRGWNEDSPVDALGIASFGPVGVLPGSPGYGRMMKTPKPGWTGIELVGQLGEAIGGRPVAIHTDVTAAAFAEGEYGAARGCSDYVYMTVGTGIGIGIIVGGRAVTGQMHPEGGHMLVRRAPGDDFPGHCPFHEDCLEGLASGPAIAARLGRRGDGVADDDPSWSLVIDALAEACANLFLTLATERIVMGGGVINRRTWMTDRIALRTSERLGGYLPFIGDRAPIVPAELGDDAGPTGSLILAEQALRRSPQTR